MNLSDTFYIALCMTVLILGVVYWFWTQNQFIQRKLNMLENIVYELKTHLDTIPAMGPTPPGMTLGGSSQEPKYAPAPGSELGEDEDLLHEELTEEASAAAPAAAVEEMGGEILSESLDEMPAASLALHASDDLQPGGVGSGIPEMEADAPAPAATAESKASVLDSMAISELRRLAEQKGLAVNTKMRKQQLIEMIRNAAATITPFEVKEEMTVHLT